MLRRCVPFAKDRATFLQLLLRLHNQGEAYGTRPSEILGMETAWGAFQLDEITLTVGRSVERNLHSNKEPFDGFALDGSTNGKGRFRSAKGLVKRKVKIPKSGIW